ncbi:PAS domain S-box protein [Pedobacter frigoris]|uniref:PAS domain S-box protein n=1 Tax=Pedobacter frigoris TaxID=2571272 RepID=UPI002930041A|nr:PAS domain S-box protein [Pedobacter frigoris]
MQNVSIFSPHIDGALFQLLVASVKEYAIFMIDTQGYILTWNDGAARIKGYQGKDVIGKHISIFYTPDDILNNEPQHNLNLALQNGTYESEGWRIRRNGSLFWANIVFTPVYHDEQHIGFAKMTRDQTERKIVEDQREAMHLELERRVKEQTSKIVANELRFRKLIEHSHDGISLLDRNFNVFFRSLSATRISGWSNEQLNSNIRRLIHPDDEALVDNTFNKVLQNPVKPIEITYRSLHHDGHYIWLECVFTNMLADEHINAIVCNFRDVSSRVASESEILSQNAVLREISWISSHEIRRPVASILGLMNLIKQTSDSKEKDEFIQMIEKCTQELDGVIHLINDKIKDLY